MYSEHYEIEDKRNVIQTIIRCVIRCAVYVQSLHGPYLSDLETWHNKALYKLNFLTFLQRVRIASNAERCIS